MWNYYNRKTLKPKTQFKKTLTRTTTKKKQVTFTTKKTSRLRKYLKFSLFDVKSARQRPFTDLKLNACERKY